MQIIENGHCQHITHYILQVSVIAMARAELEAAESPMSNRLPISRSEEPSPAPSPTPSRSEEPARNLTAEEEKARRLRRRKMLMKKRAENRERKKREEHKKEENRRLNIASNQTNPNYQMAPATPKGVARMPSLGSKTKQQERVTSSASTPNASTNRTEALPRTQQRGGSKKNIPASRQTAQRNNQNQSNTAARQVSPQRQTQPVLSHQHSESSGAESKHSVKQKKFSMQIDQGEMAVLVDATERLAATGRNWKKSLELLFRHARHGKNPAIAAMFDRGLPIDIRDEHQNTILIIAGIAIAKIIKMHVLTYTNSCSHSGYSL